MHGVRQVISPLNNRIDDVNRAIHAASLELNRVGQSLKPMKKDALIGMGGLFTPDRGYLSGVHEFRYSGCKILTRPGDIIIRRGFRKTLLFNEVIIKLRRE